MSDLFGDPHNKLIVASNGHNGIVLSWHGVDVEHFFSIYNDSYLLSDLGLDHAPAGISAWVGFVRFERKPGHSSEDMPTFNGKFRPLTTDEWADLHAASTLV